MFVNDCVLDLKSQEGSIPGTEIDPSLSLWLHKVATCVPPISYTCVESTDGVDYKR